MKNSFDDAGRAGNNILDVRPGDLEAELLKYLLIEGLPVDKFGG